MIEKEHEKLDRYQDLKWESGMALEKKYLGAMLLYCRQQAMRENLKEYGVSAPAKRNMECGVSCKSAPAEGQPSLNEL